MGVEKRKGSKGTDDESTLKVRMIKGNASELNRFTLSTKGSIVIQGLHNITIFRNKPFKEWIRFKEDIRMVFSSFD